jgi:mRNA interferase RelE/StbE
MKLLIQAKAAKQLAKLPKKDSSAILNKLRRYCDNDRDGLDVKKLVGADMLRLRHGQWRALFTDEGDLVEVIKVGHRREIYG